MKKIKIFLASSITELHADRLEFGDFIRQLNDVYEDRGIRFALIKCEDYDSAISLGGKQSELDREILDSDLVFFLFFHKVGDHTRDEFHLALKAYREKGKPRIVTYFKAVTSAEEATKEIHDFMTYLDDEVKHYYNIYQHIDSLKLGVLMQLKLLKLDTIDPTVENGKLRFGDAEIASTENIPLFAGNDSLTALQEKLANVTKKYAVLKEICSPDDETLCALAREKAKLEEDIREAEARVFKIASEMTKKTAEGGLSQRQVDAYRALEQGDYEKAREILDFDEIKRDIARNELFADTMQERLQVNVNELKQRIEVLAADGIEESEVEEITRIYEEACAVVEKYNLDKGVLYDFASFLKDMNDLERARDVAWKLLKYYELDDNVSLYRYSNLGNLLANIHFNLHNYEDAEKDYRIVLENYEALAAGCEGEDIGLYDDDIAMVCHNLGMLCKDLCRYEEAEAYHLREFEIYSRLAEADPETYEADLANAHNSLGILYKSLERYEEAEKCHLAALEIRKRLLETKPANPIPYEDALSASYNNLGNLYDVLERYEDAEEYHLAALAITKELAEFNPAAYEPDLAMSYNNLSLVYENTARYEEAEKFHLAALTIRKRLAEELPDAFMEVYAQSARNLGDLYVKLERMDDAEQYYLAAAEAYKPVVESNPAAFSFSLAKIHAWLAGYYEDEERYEEAETHYLAAIALYEKLAEDDQDAADKLSVNYNNLGLLYMDMERFEEAEKCFLDSLELTEKLQAEGYDILASNLPKTLKNLGDVYKEMGELEKAEAYYLQALPLFDALEDADDYAFIHAKIHARLAAYYSDNERNEEAKTQYLAAIALYAKLAEDDQVAAEELAVNSNNLALLYEDLERFDEAEGYYLTSLDIMKRLQSEGYEINMVDLARTTRNLGDVYQAREEYERAEDYYLDALSLFDSLENADDYAYIRARIHSELAYFCVNGEENRFGEAETHYLAAKSLYEMLTTNDPDYDYDLADMLNEFAMFYMDMETAQNEKAPLLFLETQEICERHLEENPEDFEPLLAVALYARGQIEDSEKLITRGYLLAKKYEDNDFLREYIVEDYENNH